jgi:hypothetical protein
VQAKPVKQALSVKPHILNKQDEVFFGYTEKVRSGLQGHPGAIPGHP